MTAVTTSIRLAAVGAGGALAALSLAAESPMPTFAKAPTAARAADGTVTIVFAADKPTDCEVAVADGAGRVVRHLAAGALGGTNAPPAPLKRGLAQELVWDGKDDFGKPAPAGCQVRVRLGTSAKLGKMLLDERGLAWSARAATVGPDGLLYVLEDHAQTKSTFLIQAYTRDGQYVRTVAPYPANLPPERLAGLPRVPLADGRWLPMIQNFAFRDLYPTSTGLRPQRLWITSKGWILMANPSTTHNAGTRVPQRVLVLDTAGGTPRPSYLGPATSFEPFTAGLCWLALSPDEQWIYTSGQLRRGASNDDLSTPPHHVVYRIGWDDQGQAKPFLGELNKPGADETHLNAPRGIDTDAEGRIYVCDYGNNRVAIFDKNGQWAGKIEIEAPDQVVVDRKTGAVYVLTWKPPPNSAGNPAAAPWYPVSNVKYNPASVKVEHQLVKFPKPDAAASASLEIGRPYCTMSLDVSGRQPVLWLARVMAERTTGKRCVEKVTDRGDTFEGPIEVIKARSLPDVYQVAASPASDDVFVHAYSEGSILRVDGVTGEAKVLPVRGADVAVGPQGQLVVYNYVHYFKRLARLDQYDREGKPLAFPQTGSNSVPDIAANHWGHEGTGSRGLSVSPNGDLVIIGSRENEEYSVRVLAPDGKERTVVRGVRGGDGSPVMDLAGNVYVACGPRPPGELVPGPLQGIAAVTNSYAGMYGSVIKFGPEGGQIFYPPADPKKEAWPPPDAEKLLKLALPRGADAYVKGAQWVRPGFTIIPAGPFCACYTSRFAVDLYGRVFIPDVGLFSVQVVDAANNPLLRFGDYGNADSAGPGSTIPAPAIPFAWPYGVSVGKSGVYVSDFINRRVLRVDLVHAAEAFAEIR